MSTRILDSHLPQEAMIEELLCAYRLGGSNGIYQIAGPSRPMCLALFKLTMEIFFPGYFEEHGLATVDREQVRAKVQRLSSQLRNLLDTCRLCLDPDTGEGAPDPDMGTLSSAEAVVRAFTRSLPIIRMRLMEDAEMLLSEDPAAKSIEEIIVCYPGFHAMCAYRIANQLHRSGVRIIPRTIMEHIHGITGIDIHPGADIDYPVCIDHGTGLVVGETARIGKRVKIFHGVTLGAVSVRKRHSSTKRHPTVSDGVTIYSGATILGGETVIGKNAVIGANVFLIHSVPDGTKVSL